MSAALPPPGLHLLHAAPAHWEISSLGRRGRFVAGTGFPHEHQGRSDEEYPFFKVGDMVVAENARFLRIAANSIDSTEVRALRARVCPPGAVAFAKVGAALLLNRRRITERPCVFDNNMMAFVPFGGDSRYHHYWLEQIDLARLSNPGPVPSVNESALRDVALPIPPISEQRAIADFLDRKTRAIDELIRKKERLIELLQEKRQALITQAVTKGLDPNVPMKDSGVPWLGKAPSHWDVLQLRRRIQLQRGVDITKDEQTEGTVPVVSSGGIASFHNVAYARGPGVIVGRKGSAGTVHWVDQDYWPHDTTLWVQDFGGNVPRYVYYKLVAMQLETYDTGSANPTVNRNLVHPVVVSWPTIAEQRDIASFLDRATQSIDRVQKHISDQVDLLMEYRQALISATVTGQIDVSEEAGIELPGAQAG